MNQSVWEMFTERLAYQAPQMLTLTIAVLLALRFMRRARSASMLVLIGASIKLFSIVASTLTLSLIVHALWNDPFSSTTDYGLHIKVAGIADICLETTGLILIVAAAFVGRRPRLADVVNNREIDDQTEFPDESEELHDRLRQSELRHEAAREAEDARKEADAMASQNLGGTAPQLAK